MQVQKLVATQVLIGIKTRIQAGNIERRFMNEFGDPEDVGMAFASAAGEASTQLRLLHRTVNDILGRPDSFDSQLPFFNQTYGALLPKGGLTGYAERKTREMELGLISFAQAMQEHLKISPEALTAVIDVGNFGRLLQNTLQRRFDATKEIRLTTLTAVLPQAIVESRQLVKEDWPKVPGFLEQAKVEDKNIYEWLETWWNSCSAFEATEEELQSLRMNLLADVFYGESNEGGV